MIRLPSASYAAVRALMRGSEIRSHLTFVHAVLEGRHEATVFADRLDEPSRVLVCGTSGFWFPFGAADAAFLADLDAPDVDNAWIYATTREWKSALDTLDVEPSRRIGYSSDRAAPASDTVPDGYEVRVIDRYWADRFTDGIDPWVLGIWGGAERFVNKSFGVAATHDDRVVAIGAACAIGGGEAEIEAGTDPDHRKKGIGTAVCSRFITEARRRSLEPAWSCAAGNAPSMALAARLGLTPIEELLGYQITQ